jgi:hypothetical protein
VQMGRETHSLAILRESDSSRVVSCMALLFALPVAKLRSRSTAGFKKIPIFLSPPAFNGLQPSRMQLACLSFATELTAWISYNGCICIFDEHTGWNYWHKEIASHGRNQISQTLPECQASNGRKPTHRES